MSDGTARTQLQSFVQRIERLKEEKQAIADDITEVFAEAKATGFDVKALRKVISDREKDAAELAEFEATVDTYKIALGMLADDDVRAAVLDSGILEATEKKAARKRRRDADAGSDADTGEMADA